MGDNRIGQYYTVITDSYVAADEHVGHDDAVETNPAIRGQLHGRMNDRSKPAFIDRQAGYDLCSLCIARRTAWHCQQKSIRLDPQHLPATHNRNAATLLAVV